MNGKQILGVLTGKPSRHPFPEHMRLARALAAEGMVLLKNDGGLLPLSPRKIALFGAGAMDTISCGTGSGYVYAPYTVNIRQGLTNAGFSLTSEKWLDRFERASKAANKADRTLSKLDRMWSGLSILIDDLPIAQDELDDALRADTAVYVLRRNAGECADRQNAAGDYALTDCEKANVELLAGRFAHLAVVLNTCVVDAAYLSELADALLLMGYAGNEAGNALADVLTGNVSPSGRLTDTWAKRYADNPASASFGGNGGHPLQQDYFEDIYVGYRYFDSFGVEALYPFGYGLGYSEFSMTLTDFRADWQTIELQIVVQNTGAHDDREVAQVYVSAPETRLPKPYQELKGFTKTRTLKPGEKQALTVSIPTESLASYDTLSASFGMEAGDYLIRVGHDSRQTNVAAVLRVSGNAVTRRVHDALAPDHPLELFSAPPQRREAPPDAPVVTLDARDCMAADDTRDLPPRFSPEKPQAVTLPDVQAKRASMSAFVSSLDDEVLFRLVTGAASETPCKVAPRGKARYRKVKAPSSSGATTALFTSSLGIPAWYVTDGPAGAHLPFCGATCWPAGMVLAQTWDPPVLEEMGAHLGKEIAFYHHSVILGPGMNIHRDPLCGRCFEYFSEDPLLTGKIAAGVTRGVQSVPGAAVSIKHFCCNNQEAERATENNTVSQRALREIYLRGFEICVREASPRTVMSSYNQVNGKHTSSSRELLTDILRAEWGFDGLVMTDWGSQSDKVEDLKAGNNLIMGGYRSVYLRAALDGAPPVFAADGYVRIDKYKVYGGFMTEEVENWNSFAPAQGGADHVTAEVSAGVTLSPKISQMEKDGIAVVAGNPDGSKRVTYSGVSRGQTLSREVLEQNAAAVLTEIMRSVSFADMMAQSK